MIDSFLRNIAPHYCCGCEERGVFLCQSCENDIVSERFSYCIRCLSPSVTSNICAACKPSYSKAWCVSIRDEIMEKIVNAYKFDRVYEALEISARLLSRTLPSLPRDMIIVPIPTVPKHIRIRGYDHTRQMAIHIARQHGVRYAPLVSRRTNSVQLNASRPVRIRQAQEAFHVQPLEGGRYLIIDDVYTTGSTVEYASRQLRRAGAEEVWVAVLSRQVLD